MLELAAKVRIRASGGDASDVAFLAHEIAAFVTRAASWGR
jgi:hypothetical protein